MRIVGPYGAIISWHFRVGPVVLLVILAGHLRLERGRAAPSHFGPEDLQFGRPPVIFVNEGGAISIDANSSTRVAQVTTSVVCTGVVASTRAEQLLPVVVMVSGVKVVGAEPSVTRCCYLRIDTMATF